MLSRAKNGMLQDTQLHRNVNGEMKTMGALDPAGYPVNLVDPGWIRIQCIWIRFGSGSGSDLDPARSEVKCGKYWPDLHKL